MRLTRPKTLLHAVAACLVTFSVTLTQAQEALRPEVGKPLQAAQELIRAQKYREALAKIREADTVGNKTANETFMIERMRGSAAAGAGDNETAIRAYEAVINSGRLSPGQQLPFIEGIAGAYYRARDYASAAKWAQRAVKEGGGASARALLTNSLYLAGDMASAMREVSGQVRAAEAAGQAPAEESLQLLTNIALKQNDKAAYVAALEKLVTYYPKKEYWQDLVQRISSKPGFSDRHALTVYRLKLARGQLTSANDYMEMSQLAMQAGIPAEARKVVEQGFSAGILGAGAEADRQKRLRDMVGRAFAEEDKNRAKVEAEAAAAKDGTALVNLGYGYVAVGQADKGLNLMEQGIRKGGMKRSEDAKLLLGIAYLYAGQKMKAQQVLRAVEGADGTADLARLWLIHGRQS
jgi:hypothetical protein